MHPVKEKVKRDLTRQAALDTYSDMTSAAFIWWQWLKAKSNAAAQNCAALVRAGADGLWQAERADRWDRMAEALEHYTAERVCVGGAR